MVCNKLTLQINSCNTHKVQHQVVIIWRWNVAGISHFQTHTHWRFMVCFSTCPWVVESKWDFGIPWPIANLQHKRSGTLKLAHNVFSHNLTIFEIKGQNHRKPTFSLIVLYFLFTIRHWCWNKKARKRRRRAGPALLNTSCSQFNIMIGPPFIDHSNHLKGTHYAWESLGMYPNRS